MKHFLLCTGVLSIFYFLIYAVFAGLANKFTFFWLLLGIVLIGISVYYDQIPDLIKKGMLIISVLFLCLIGISEYLIITNAVKAPVSNADYVIVLGAQVKGTVPSYALEKRLDSALAYLNKNPDTKVIVTGGKGTGEKITEAECEKNYLLEHGIKKERILVENKSTSTYENFKNSEVFFNKDDQMVVCTNSFHVYRSLGIIKKMGYKNVSGIGSPIKKYTALNLYFREGLAVIKSILTHSI